jgi:3',5'-cyclic AMP phosphodiesterase CpdA
VSREFVTWRPSGWIIRGHEFCTYFHFSISLCDPSRGISTDVQAARIQNQLVHIEAMLVEAIRHNPTWLLVAGHYPVFSTGQHGDTSELKSYLLPLLTKYKVHAYFCGHDHFSGTYVFFIHS